ncbi:hypothetical protein L211DRAFT_854359 [Terfezia boudieri ATCC MYA-4762]|uniref:Uncharacterized protein n=1 Tax=Terfezia boudieri ATCC MYA-4762 TaxID=1051890 RepID=A0A3N4LC23_9PEZI|nr:hypothetical protein L211DRAFT_854359 [Terfezia boudieri ATCC MYA-4762]
MPSLFHSFWLSLSFHVSSACPNRFVATSIKALSTAGSTNPNPACSSKSLREITPSAFFPFPFLALLLFITSLSDSPSSYSSIPSISAHSAGVPAPRALFFDFGVIRVHIAPQKPSTVMPSGPFALTTIISSTPTSIFFHAYSKSNPSKSLLTALSWIITPQVRISIVLSADNPSTTLIISSSSRLSFSS